VTSSCHEWKRNVSHSICIYQEESRHIWVLCTYKKVKKVSQRRIKLVYTTLVLQEQAREREQERIYVTDFFFNYILSWVCYTSIGPPVKWQRQWECFLSITSRNSTISMATIIGTALEKSWNKLIQQRGKNPVSMQQSSKWSTKLSFLSLNVLS
jgi:hypothetical protein